MTVRRAAAALLAIAATTGIAWLSTAPTDFLGDAGAAVRLSWRVDGVPVEACRTRTEEELAALPVHMRSPLECERTLAPFALDVDLGGRPVVRDTVFPRGVRGDRPLYVFRDFPVAPGRTAVSVRFEALAADGAEGVPTRYRWNGEVQLNSGDVALVTMGEDGQLELRTPES